MEKIRTQVSMADKFINLRINEEIHKRYKVICAEFKIQQGKQAEALIKAFVETQENNIKMLKEARKE